MTHCACAANHQRARFECHVAIPKRWPLVELGIEPAFLEATPGGVAVGGDELAVLFLNEDTCDHHSTLPPCVLPLHHSPAVAHDQPSKLKHRRLAGPVQCYWHLRAGRTGAKFLALRLLDRIQHVTFITAL